MHNQNEDIWIFVDETGTSALKDKSNPVFGFGFLATKDPVKIAQILTQLKYQIWKKTKVKDKVIGSFHASGGNNPKWVKTDFYDHLFTQFEQGSFFENFSFTFILKEVVDEFLQRQLFHSPQAVANLGKNGLSKETLSNFAFYFEFNEFWLVQIYFFLIHNYLINPKLLAKYRRINLVLSKIFSRQEEKALYQGLKREFPNINLEIYWVDGKTDCGCQLADYFTWAVHRFLINQNKNDAIGFTFLEKTRKMNIVDITESIYKVYLLQQVSTFQSFKKINGLKTARKLEEILSLSKNKNPTYEEQLSPGNLIPPLQEP